PLRQEEEPVVAVLPADGPVCCADQNLPLVGTANGQRRPRNQLPVRGGLELQRIGRIPRSELGRRTADESRLALLQRDSRRELHGALFRAGGFGGRCVEAAVFLRRKDEDAD